MQELVDEIVQAYGYESLREMPVDDYISLDPHEAINRLVIERMGTDHVVVGQYYKLNGDRMADPEVVYRLDGDLWVPVEYLQHLPLVQEYDDEGLDLGDFEETWEENLRGFGFVEAAEEDAAQEANSATDAHA